LELDLSPHEDPEQDNPERHAVARRSTLVSVAVNLVLTTVQVLVGVLAHSQALIADGIHSLSDLIADFVVLLATRHSSKEADDDHHYGHHRYETAASLVLGALLLTVGLGMLWSAVHKLGDPDAIPHVQPIALYVALGALVAKELLFRYMLAAAERVRSSMLVANAWHARSDAASSLVVALGIVGNLMGYPLLDPVAALIVGLLVTKGVHGVHDLRTRKMGDMLMVDAHLEVDGELSVREGHDIATNARDRVMAKMPVLDVMAHLDPVMVQPSRGSGAHKVAQGAPGQQAAR
jgi:divalent metal cation (Fe/Co/Zn/Cd) transporter